MSNYKKEIGKKGEEMAVKLLMNKGYKIIERNWYYHRNELDIIAEYDDKIIFVEVKTRTEGEYVEPDFAVSKRKQSAIIKAADGYLIQKDIDKEARFDIVSVIIYPGGTAIEHIEDAFYPMA